MVLRLLGVESRFYKAERDVLTERFEPLPHYLPQLESAPPQRRAGSLGRCLRRMCRLAHN